MFVVVIAVGLAAAQGGPYPGPFTGTYGTATTSGAGYTAGTGLSGYDILGAHQNGGRGCAGCHAPHSGSAGGGGNVGTYTGTQTDPLSGSDALFGQDVAPLLGYQLKMGNGITETLPGESTAYTTQTAELEGIAMCLACHDGVVAKGGMMVGTSWEQRMNLLPAGVYGTHLIPTLLGNDSGDGNTSGYANDHPVGVNATLAAVGVASSLTFTTSSAGNLATITPATTAYKAFVANYGYPAIAGSVWSFGVAIQSTDTTGATAFITCTTCHNQHSMYVYTASPSYGVGYQGATAKIVAGGSYPTYFFINSPYNPGAGNNNPQLAASTTQFCRQCHFDTSNENAGVTTVQTQF
jgi:hypothetical protein